MKAELNIAITDDGGITLAVAGPEATPAHLLFMVEVAKAQILNGVFAQAAERRIMPAGVAMPFTARNGHGG